MLNDMIDATDGILFNKLNVGIALKCLEGSRGEDAGEGVQFEVLRRTVVSSLVA